MLRDAAIPFEDLAAKNRSADVKREGRNLELFAAGLADELGKAQPVRILHLGPVQKQHQHSMAKGLKAAKSRHSLSCTLFCFQCTLICDFNGVF